MSPRRDAQPFARRWNLGLTNWSMTEHYGSDGLPGDSSLVGIEVV